MPLLCWARRSAAACRASARGRTRWGHARPVMNWDEANRASRAAVAALGARTRSVAVIAQRRRRRRRRLWLRPRRWRAQRPRQKRRGRARPHWLGAPPVFLAPWGAERADAAARAQPSAAGATADLRTSPPAAAGRSATCARGRSTTAGPSQTTSAGSRPTCCESCGPSAAGSCCVTFGQWRACGSVVDRL